MFFKKAKQNLFIPPILLWSFFFVCLFFFLWRDEFVPVALDINTIWNKVGCSFFFFCQIIGITGGYGMSVNYMYCIAKVLFKLICIKKNMVLSTWRPWGLCAEWKLWNLSRSRVVKSCGFTILFFSSLQHLTHCRFKKKEEKKEKKEKKTFWVAFKTVINKAGKCKNKVQHLIAKQLQNLQIMFKGGVKHFALRRRGK